MQKDFYEVLGLSRTATKDEINKAFRKLAQKYHPDKQGGDAQKFKEINEAYQTLSDDKKRKEYDTYGRVFGGGGGPQQGGWPGGGAAGFDFGDIFSGAQWGGEGGPDLGDIFEDLFGGRGPRVRRGRDISIDLEVPFKESIFGTERTVLITKVGSCATCKGNGAKPGTALTKCTTCGGKGKVQETRRSFLGSFTSERECATCAGRGEMPATKCETCSGAGVLKKSEEITIKIPAGIEDGEMIKLVGQGEAISAGTPGDLYVKIHVERDPTWRREGTSLVTELNVKLTDALLGGEYTLHALDGDLSLTIPEGVAFGETLRVRGRGVPMDTKGKRGDLLVRISIKTPSKLSKNARGMLEKLREEGI